MKKIIRTINLFIIFLTIICFLISNSVYAMDFEKNTNDLRYNFVSHGADKATENIIADMEKANIKDAESFKKNKGTISVLGVWQSTITQSSYYKIANSLMTDKKYEEYEERIYYTKDESQEHGGAGYRLKTLEERIGSEKYRKTYKEIYDEYGIDFEKKDSKEKVDVEMTRKVYDAYTITISKIENELKKEQEKNDIISGLEDTEKGAENKKELENYDWIKVMDNKYMANSLLENGYESIVKKWLETLEDKDSEIIWDADGSDYTRQDLRAAIEDFKTMLEQNEESNHIYKLPLKNTTSSTNSSLEDVINDGDAFIGAGNEEDIYNDSDLQNFSKTIYNILLAAGIFIATATGGVLGIKMMTSSVEEQAEVKKLLIPYVVGCVVIFGGFGIWKLVITILQTI